jgi:hypothetical protein
MAARTYNGMIGTFPAPNQIALVAAYRFETRRRTKKSRLNEPGFDGLNGAKRLNVLNNLHIQ